MGAGAENPWKWHVWRTERSNTRGSSADVVLFQGLRGQQHTMRCQSIVYSKNASDQLSPHLTPVLKQKLYFFRASDEWENFSAPNLTFFPHKIIHFPRLCLLTRIWCFNFQAQHKIQKIYYCCNCACVCNCNWCYYYGYDYYYWPINSQSLWLSWLLRSHQSKHRKPLHFICPFLHWAQGPLLLGETVNCI